MSIHGIHIKYILGGIVLLALDFGLFWYFEVSEKTVNFNDKAEMDFSSIVADTSPDTSFPSFPVKTSKDGTVSGNPVKNQRSRIARSVQKKNLTAFSVPENITVLSFHDLSRTRIPNSIISPVSAFEDMIVRLKQRGYEPFFASEMKRLAGGFLPLKSGHRPVVITFDDGYKNNYSLLFPLLKKHQIKATIFLITGKLKEQRSHKNDNCLTFSELKEMAASGYVELGSHTHNLHSNLVKLLSKFDNPHNKKKCLYDIYRDLKTSRKVMKERLGIDITSLAWPHGKENKYLVYAARKAGFTEVFNTRFGTNSTANFSAFSLKRISASSPWLTSTELIRRIESVGLKPELISRRKSTDYLLSSD